MIKKRKLKVDNRSKRIPLEKEEELKTKSDDNSGENEQEDKLFKLGASKNLKLLQNIRLKKKGINAENLSYESKILEKDEKENKLLEKQFTKNITEKEIEEAHIESFINYSMKEFFEEEEHKKKRGEDAKEESYKEEQKQNQGNTINDLYKLSNHLKVKSSINNSEKLNCITGITEMPLPLEIKLKNIEENEKIKRKLLKKAKFMNTKK
ncbi:conserved protein, unknown function [Plasmodium malariae]|uniref:Telomere length and silencing protein 1 n=1 Tax=Plasmodium malariae TaxID=5858 RepID=A0A1C3L145_PLAMA|nr:conserved protein, unknown function [Plasmodium malariae]